MHFGRNKRPADVEMSGTDLLKFIDQALDSSRSSVNLMAMTSAILRDLSKGVPADLPALARMADEADRDVEALRAKINALDASKLALISPQGQA